MRKIFNADHVDNIARGRYDRSVTFDQNYNWFIRKQGTTNNAMKFFDKKKNLKLISVIDYFHTDFDSCIFDG